MNASLRRGLIGLGLLGCLVLLAGCSAAATMTPAETPAESVQTVEVEVVVQPTSGAPPSATPAGVLTQPVPTQAPETQPAPLITIEARLVELEWPPRMRLGESDVVRLALVPVEQGYQVQLDFPEHQVLTQTIVVSRQGGYALSGVARLDGVNFVLSPQAEQPRALPTGEKVTWQWSLKPLAAGQQRLAVTLLLRWTPLEGTPGSLRESTVYTRGLDVQVSSFFGLTRGQALTGGFLGLLLGGGLSLFGLAALVLPPRSLVRQAAPNPSLSIEPSPGLQLNRQESALLRSLFRRYGRLVLESEFLSGYSGARTFLALPVRPDGAADAHTIVKIGEKAAIQREYENYQTFVRDRLPPITARIQHPPVSAPGGEKAALQYTFIGAPGQTPVSLRLALLENPDPALLTRLFETFGPNWWMQRRPYTFRMAQEYDCLLPTHFVIQPASGRGAQFLDGRLPVEEQPWQPGELVTLRNFARAERRADGHSQSLLGTPAPGRAALRVRWMSLANPNGAVGRIADTRQSLLEGITKSFDRQGLPDPLKRLSELLNQTVRGSLSTIHGDLNPENVLVGPGGFVWLIDFATTREGHPLFDFAHLEAEIIAHVLAPTVAPADYLAAWRAGIAEGSPPPYSLLETLHTIAGRCLFNPDQPHEYHLALVFACLGALKYENLSPAQKSLLYLTAAYWVNELI